MQFAVALVEYLISGIVASVWVVAVVGNFIQLPLNKINEYKEIFVVVYFPVAYILGIYVDATSSFLIRRVKELDVFVRAKSKIYLWLRTGLVLVNKFLSGNPKKDSYERSAEILSHSIPDAVRTMDAYVSRDRIARGAALNSFAGALTALAYAPVEVKSSIFFGCLILFIYSLLMYKRLRRLSSQFKRAAIDKIDSQKVGRVGEKGR